MRNPVLECVTFTGIDESTSFERIRRLSALYPAAEFAILIGTHSGDRRIHPPIPHVVAWRDFAVRHRIPTALHLCGKYSQIALDSRLWPRIWDICCGFGRIQVNLPAATRDAYAPRVAHFAANVQTIGARVILQHSDQSWNTIPLKAGEVDYLYDLSGGRGVKSIRAWFPPALEGIHNWPTPEGNRERWWGFAGGLGPDNIHEALMKIGSFPSGRYWIDMEKRIRKGGWYNLDLIEEVCEAVFGRDLLWIIRVAKCVQ